MPEPFSIERLQTRSFRATHLASGQIFELRGRQGVHYWEAHRVEAGKVSKHIFMDDWQSKKKLLENLDAKIMQEMHKAVALAEFEKQKQQIAAEKAAKKGLMRFRPEIYAKLQRKTVNKSQTILNAPESNEKFVMYSNKEGYRIEHYNQPKAQPICTGIDTENEAILELYYYLDTGADPEKYRAECFRKG